MSSTSLPSSSHIPSPHTRTADRHAFWWSLAGVLAILITFLWRGDVLIGFLAVAVIFVPAERLVELRPQRILRSGWRTDVMHYFVSSALTTLGLTLVTVAAALGVRMFIGSHLGHAIASQPLVLQLGESTFLSAVVQYWVHRASHTWPVLWRFHAVHHSIRTMDWLASARFHPVDQVVTRGAAVIPITILGFAPVTFGWYIVMDALQEFFVHANMRVPLGIFRWILPNPEFHHWHHAVDREAWNTNFSGYPFIDLLFRTAYMPKGRRPRGYGIDQDVSTSYLGQLLRPFHPEAGSCAGEPSHEAQLLVKEEARKGFPGRQLVAEEHSPPGA